MANNKYITNVFILLCILVGTALRVYNFPHTLSWNGDIGRDFLAGKLIATGTPIPLVGHFNSGLSDFYPPTYYALMGLITFLAGNQLERVYFALILLQVLTIFILYLTASQFFGKKNGLFTLFFLTISPYFIHTAQNPLSAHTSLLFFALSLYYLAKSTNSNQLIFLIATAFFLVMAGSIYYGAFFFIPIQILIVLTAKNGSLNKKIQNTLAYAISGIVTYLGFFWMILRNKNPFEILYLDGFESSPSLISYLIPLENIFATANNILSEYLGLQTILVGLMIGIIIAVSAFDKKISLISILSFFFIFIFHSYVIALFENRLSHYFVLAAFTLLLFLNYFFSEIKKTNRAIATVYFFTFLFAIKPYDYFDSTQTISNAEISRAIAEEIHTSFPDSYLLSLDSCGETFETWDSRSYWYFTSDSQSFSFSSSDSLISPATDNYILICNLQDEAEIVEEIKYQDTLYSYSQIIETYDTKKAVYKPSDLTRIIRAQDNK